MYQAVIFFLQSFANFHFCEDGNFRALKSRVKNVLFRTILAK